MVVSLDQNPWDFTIDKRRNYWLTQRVAASLVSAVGLTIFAVVKIGT